MSDDYVTRSADLAAARRMMLGGDVASEDEVWAWLRNTAEGQRFAESLSTYVGELPIPWQLPHDADRQLKPAPRDYSGVEKRGDLPARAYTIAPQGKIHPLFNGRGIGGVMEASVEPICGGSYTVLTCKVLLTEAAPVPWDVLGRLAGPEIATMKAAGGVVLTWDNGTQTVLD